MARELLDEVDRGILHSLQQDARNISAAAIAEEVGVTANTVRNRITDLENRGIIEGYEPVINYENADYQIKVVMICTAPITERSVLAQEALDVSGVTHVREIMTGKKNVFVTAVTEENEKMTAIASQLTELGLVIEAEELVKNDYSQPFDHFVVDTTGS